jgi:excisionase family DNA binding protein
MPDGTGQRTGRSRGVERIAYSVPETARALGLSRELIYDELRSKRLGSVKVGWRRIITRQHIDA